jgi:aminoglycoside phosphotransferase family enzyme/predicted kinase
MAGDQQDAVFALLADPATHGGTKVKRIDTHAAAVFLAGEHAFKIKRAVKFPFLDFSTLEKRKAALQSEIEANKPFAPQLYLGLVLITREGGALKLGGDGETIEWALKMRRFDETQTLDHLANAGKVDGQMAGALARLIAAAHEHAPKVEVAPWIAALSEYIEQNDQAFREHAKLFDAKATERLTTASRDAFVRLRPLLEQRGAQGLIRRGHGDLHLGNIALIDGQPLPFDALEFDPLVASGDLLYDLAFLLMDLDERKLSEAAATALNIYFAASRRDGDIEALAALPLFMSVRAAIRAKVTAARIANADAGKRDAITKEAQTYFALACKLIAPPKPKLLAVGGLSGTGKSVLARGLSFHVPPLPGALVLRSDIERKVMFNVGETDRLPADAYTLEITDRVYQTLADKARRVIAAGHSAIVDAVFARPQERAAISKLAHEKQLDFHGLFLTADMETRIKRVGARVNDASDAGAEIARRQEDYDLGDLDWHKIDASGTPDDTLRNALAKLKP